MQRRVGDTEEASTGTGVSHKSELAVLSGRNIHAGLSDDPLPSSPSSNAAGSRVEEGFAGILTPMGTGSLSQSSVQSSPIR